MQSTASDYVPIALPGCEEMVAEQEASAPDVHPVAAMFPMMSDAELDELAADIKANGLVHPIVRDKDGQLIDGRNRLWACEIAGVEPRYTTLPDGADPASFILSCNVQRRHMSKGQRAMAAARAREFSFNENPTQQTVASAVEVSTGYVGQADVILEYAPELADTVMAGDMPLNEAYALAKDAKAMQDGRNLDVERAAADLRRLQAEASDLADQVVEERLTLAEALAALAARLDEAKRKRRVATVAYAAVVRTLLPGDWTPAERANLIVSDLDGEFADDLALDGIEARACAATLLAIAEQLDDQGDESNG